MHVPVLLAASCWNSFWIYDLPCSQIDLNFQHYHSDHRHQNLEKMFMCCSVLHLKLPNVVYFSTPFTGQNHLFGRLTFFFNRKKQEKKQKKENSRQKRRVYQHFNTTPKPAPKHWQTRKSWLISRKIMIFLNLAWTTFCVCNYTLLPEKTEVKNQK